MSTAFLEMVCIATYCCFLAAIPLMIWDACRISSPR